MPPISEYAPSTLPLRIQEAFEWHESDYPNEIHERLADHKLLRLYVDFIEADVEDGTLTLSGTLPSYYLKQTLQIALQDLPGVLHVDNKVRVPRPCTVELTTPRRRELVYD